MAVVAATGYIILSKTADRKWGYTKEREKELENTDADKFFKGHRKY